MKVADTDGSSVMQIGQAYANMDDSIGPSCSGPRRSRTGSLGGTARDLVSCYPSLADIPAFQTCRRTLDAKLARGRISDRAAGLRL